MTPPTKTGYGSKSMHVVVSTFDAWINRGLRWILYILISFMVFLIALQICARSLLPLLNVHVSWPWTEELARYLMIWVVFLGAALAARHRLLIALTIITDLLPKKLYITTHVLGLIILIGFSALLVEVGMEWMLFNTVETAPATNLSMQYVYLAMPVGGIGIIVNSLYAMRDICVNNVKVEVYT